MTPSPLQGVRPTTRILVAGYGALTSGILPHLTSLPDAAVTLASRHLTASPDPLAVLIQPDHVDQVRPDVIVGCFADDERSQAFWEHPSTTTALTDCRPACIELSTVSPTWAEEWHQRLQHHGTVPVESPVTGSRPGARAGALTAFVYSPSVDERAERVLAAFTRNRHRFTAAGRPARFKLLYNAWGAAILHSLGVYARLLPQHLGEDAATAREIVTTDGWMSVIASMKLERILGGDYSDPDFAATHMAKDLHYARNLLGSSPLIDLTLDAFEETVEVHGPYADFTAVAAPGAS
ncbi:NAD(P)-binding domain-containing protein [Streptomyces sp. NBC_01077]|uniref:NAD(P)-binding domain-containing protein n=1 Tax=Streptomyces sp. NBC_01077 TaxID=2903746 RepID=UPI00386FDA52|nr:NAD(P)-binding domain-containing protein [Streptomyces sp. NBC_01077]WSV43515.1 NAD(P)-binding domain-containing protein [Streptomyces sp. NBC_01077]